jgi:glycosyltransferase involved in cell wall biosynthesis
VDPAEELVSIITPCFNAERYIAICIQSVSAQTYFNWEMLIVDDCSTDNSIPIISEYVKKDSRIKLFSTEGQSGSPVLPRNIGIQNARGRYIAFLDSDDVWLPKKLECQIELLNNKDTAVAFSYYEKISEDGGRSNRIIFSPDIVTYKRLLKGNCIGNLTAMYDTSKTGKVFFPSIGHEDYALWLDILRMGYIARNTRTVEALYRTRKNSLSTNKLVASRWTWNIYYQYLRLSFLKSLCYFIIYLVKASVKFLK